MKTEGAPPLPHSLPHSRYDTKLPATKTTYKYNTIAPLTKYKQTLCQHSKLVGYATNKWRILTNLDIKNINHRQSGNEKMDEYSTFSKENRFFKGIKNQTEMK